MARVLILHYDMASITFESVFEEPCHPLSNALHQYIASFTLGITVG